jgi:predicted nucleotidyltransferase
MIALFSDISEKIEQPVVEAVSDIDRISGPLAVPFVVVGAKARDLIFSGVFGIPTRRATLDVDLAVRMKSWDEYAAFTGALVREGAFAADDKRISHRFRHSNGTLVDLLPFGGIENPPGSVSWPPDFDTAMSTIGFSDLFDSAVGIRFRREPILDVRVATLAGLAAAKLIAWGDSPSMRARDAADLHFLMTKYIDAGNDDRLFADDADISREPDFDYGIASPRLLGRDMAAILSKATRARVEQILGAEASEESDLRLVRSMLTDVHEDDEIARGLDLLKQLYLGLTERK